jgi:hypothetical protein
VESDREEIPTFDLIFAVDKDRLAISESTLNDAQQRIFCRYSTGRAT